MGRGGEVVRFVGAPRGKGERGGPPILLRDPLADRTLAVDPAHIPLGTPVWIEFEGQSRLCVAQDIGSAIKGPNRGDLYCGTGADAGLRAGSLNAEVTMTLLLPREVST